MDCSGCDYYRESIINDVYDIRIRKVIKTIKYSSVCLLARLPVLQLSFCPNRDGIAPSDFVTCESCGKVVSYEESTYKKYSPLLFKWFGECKQCSRKKNVLCNINSHKCERWVNRYGICTSCGAIQPGSSLMNIPLERGEERKE